MDLTCLRAFDFSDPYVFRAHQIGLIGNLIKVPPGSELMQQTFERADKVANENVSWLTLNKSCGIACTSCSWAPTCARTSSTKGR